MNCYTSNHFIAITSEGRKGRTPTQAEGTAHAIVLRQDHGKLEDVAGHRKEACEEKGEGCR